VSKKSELQRAHEHFALASHRFQSQEKEAEAAFCDGMAALAKGLENALGDIDSGLFSVKMNQE
jgi:hypothetical protein